MTSQHPLTKHNIYIHESKTALDCSILNPSYVDKKETADNELYVTKGPYNVLDAENYILSEVNKFIKMAQIAGQCSLYKKIPRMPKEPTISQMECETIFSNLGATYEYGFPSYSVSAPENNPNVLPNRKQLCQRLQDLNNLLSSFQTNVLSHSVSKKDDPAFKDHYAQIMKIQRENENLRISLDKDIDELYNNDNFQNVKKQLDYTIYTTVLWTVLATTLLFFLFMKM